MPRRRTPAQLADERLLEIEIDEAAERLREAEAEELSEERLRARDAAFVVREVREAAALQRQIERLQARAMEFSDEVSRVDLAEIEQQEADPQRLTARERAAGVADCTFVRNGEYLITDAENERELGNYLIYTVQSGPLEGTRVIKRLVRGVWRGFAFLDNTSTPPGGLLLWQRFAEDADEPYVRVAEDMLDYLRSGVPSIPMMRTTWTWSSPGGPCFAAVTPACVVCNHRPALAINGWIHCRTHAPLVGNVLIYEDHQDDAEAEVPEVWRPGPRRLDRPPTNRAPQPPLLSELGTGEPL